MVYRIAYAVCAASLALVSASVRAGPLATYTWETLSQSNPEIPLTASFTVSGPVSIDACNYCGGGPPPADPPTLFSFPPELMAFNLDVRQLSITLASFTSIDARDLIYPDPLWSLSLQADPVAQTGGFALFFSSRGPLPDSNQITGPNFAETPGFASTSGGALWHRAEDLDLHCNPCSYTGVLVTNTVQELSSLWLAISAIAVLGLLQFPLGSDHSTKYRSAAAQRDLKSVGQFHG
jgi:hypothetical protein